MTYVSRIDGQETLLYAGIPVLFSVSNEIIPLTVLRFKDGESPLLFIAHGIKICR